MWSVAATLFNFLVPSQSGKTEVNSLGGQEDHVQASHGAALLQMRHTSMLSKVEVTTQLILYRQWLLSLAAHLAMDMNLWTLRSETSALMDPH